MLSAVLPTDCGQFPSLPLSLCPLAVQRFGTFGFTHSQVEPNHTSQSGGCCCCCLSFKAVKTIYTSQVGQPDSDAEGEGVGAAAAAAAAAGMRVTIETRITLRCGFVDR